MDEEIIESNPVESSEAPAQDEASAQDSVYDLDSAKKWKFGGEEYDAQSWKSKWVPYSKHQKDVSNYRQDEKFQNALKFDLDKIKGNPELVAEFKRIYPKKYHYLADYFQPAGQQQQQPGQSNSEKVPQSVLDDLEFVKGEIHQNKVKAAQAEVDNIFQKYGTKYPFADEGAVTSLAMSMIDKMKEDGEDVSITDSMWDNIFKSVNDRIKGLADKHYKQTVTKQTQANAKARDIPSGGGVPAQAPKGKLSWNEAMKAMEDDMRNSLQR